MWWRMKCQIVTLIDSGVDGRMWPTWSAPSNGISVEKCSNLSTRQFPIISMNDDRHMEVRRKTRYPKLVPLLLAWQAPFWRIYRRQLFVAVNQIVTNVSTGLCTWRLFCDKCNDIWQTVDRFLHSLSDFAGFSSDSSVKGHVMFGKIYILFTHIIKFLIHRRRDCNKFNEAFEHLLHIKRGSVISTRSSTQISEQWQILWLMSNRTETGGKFSCNLIENNYLPGRKKWPLATVATISSASVRIERSKETSLATLNRLVHFIPCLRSLWHSTNVSWVHLSKFIFKHRRFNCESSFFNSSIIVLVIFNFTIFSNGHF